MSEEKPKSKFRFEENMDCGACCINRGPIPLTLYDIEYWAAKKIIGNMFPYLKINQTPLGITELIMDIMDLPKEKEERKEEEKNEEEEKEEEKKDDDAEKKIEEDSKQEDEKGDDDEEITTENTIKLGKCPMYNVETKKCLIWTDRPLYCRAFPLGYDGINFFIKMEDCPGINASDTMDKEILKQMRNDAKREFEGKRLLGITLPILQGIVMKTLQEENLKAMSKLAPEDLEKLQSVFQKLGEKDQ
ncbi:MAG: YkgJ family cysteine cluster protein [Candidatus Hodarchaeota archaeon]